MPELRKDPVLGRWVIIATDRAKRPKDFPPEVARQEITQCPFCPGNEVKTPQEILAYRDDPAQKNQPGWKLRVVSNKFPALRIEGELLRRGRGVYDMMNGIGAHEVIIESPDHYAMISDLPLKSVEEIIWAYRDRLVDLRKDLRLKYAMVFKNHGAAAGASLEHPHSQIIALPIIPQAVIGEMNGAKQYYDYRERCIYCDIVQQEIEEKDRVIYENYDFLVICPYAPRFPFETWILPKEHDSCFEDSKKDEYLHLADALSTIVKKLNKALGRPAYNYMLHNSPFDNRNNAFYHWHIEITPIISTVAGFEWGTGFYINPIPPEEAARFLREIE
jgi:UDPglucose--hexose-1-phosphate uridylyltransferase